MPEYRRLTGGGNVRGMHSVGLVLHPQRDSAAAVESVLEWAARRNIPVYGVEDEIKRLNCAAIPVPANELGRHCDLLVSLGGDGTMLRAMRLADRQRGSVLGVNLGKLGFLAEVDVPDLPAALTAIDSHQYTIEPRLAIDSALGAKTITAFNDVAIVRVPGKGSALVAVHVDDEPFVSYAADAVVVATPTGSTAYSFSAGGPIVSPAVQALLVTPAAPHSAYNRGLVISSGDTVTLEILPASGRLAVEVDGEVAGYLETGMRIDLRARPDAARVIRLGRTTFFERARRKLRLTDSAEIPPEWRDGVAAADEATASGSDNSAGARGDDGAAPGQGVAPAGEGLAVGGAGLAAGGASAAGGAGLAAGGASAAGGAGLAAGGAGLAAGGASAAGGEGVAAGDGSHPG
jgi:NAD+ kinase